MGAELLEEIVMAIFLPRRIPVHPKGADLGKNRMERALDMLRSKSFELQRLIGSACGALPRRRPLIVAEMAAEELHLFMEGEPQIAVGAFEDRAASSANLEPVIAAPVKEEEGLFARFQPLFDPSRSSSEKWVKPP